MAESKKHVRQFTVKSDKPKSYDRRVRKQGHTTVISLGKIIPEDWRYVRLKILGKTDKVLFLRIEKLLGAEDNAQATTTNQEHQ